MEFGVRHSMVLATDHLPKRQRPYRVVNVGLTDCFGIEWASEFPKAALIRGSAGRLTLPHQRSLRAGLERASARRLWPPRGFEAIKLVLAALMRLSIAFRSIQ